jgi:hypothetical protein
VHERALPRRVLRARRRLRLLRHLVQAVRLEGEELGLLESRLADLARTAEQQAADKETKLTALFKFPSTRNLIAVYPNSAA